MDNGEGVLIDLTLFRLSMVQVNTLWERELAEFMLVAATVLFEVPCIEGKKDETCVLNRC
jgi:hypothetical protein